MMVRYSRNLLTLAAGAALSACGQAIAAADASRDIDCSVLAFYFKGLGEHTGAPADQQRAAVVVHEWYAAKVRTLTADRGSRAVLSEAEPILDSVKRDPKTAGRALAACADRAAADPDFDAFARRISRQ